MLGALVHALTSNTARALCPCGHLHCTPHVHCASLRAHAAYTEPALCTIMWTDSVHYASTVHSAPLGALKVKTVITKCTSDVTDSVHCTCIAIHAHQVCKCSAMLNPVTQQGVQSALQAYVVHAWNAPFALASHFCGEQLL